MMQFALISLIPGLIRNLQDSADPSLDSYGRTVERPTTLKTSERSSCALVPSTCVDMYRDVVYTDEHSTIIHGTTIATIREGTQFLASRKCGDF
jgi:hypothetical protein